MTTLPVSAQDRPAAPRLAAYNTTTVGLDIRRIVRNRRTVVLAMMIPLAFFLLFGLHPVGNAAHYSRGNASAALLISIAVYGAVSATTNAGASVSVERATGWSRQLRLTPLTPSAYIAAKMTSSFVLSAAAVAVVYAGAAVTGKPEMPAWVWLLTAAAVCVGSLSFAAFGLFVGYLLPTENVTQIVGVTTMLVSFAGGLFIPLAAFSPGVRTAASFTPLWGLNGLVHYPLGDDFDYLWVVNLAAWLAIFSAGAAWRFSTATSRV